MNDSNSMFNNNNDVTPTPQRIDANGVNVAPQTDNLTTNVNSTIDNNVISSNSVQTPQQNSFNSQVNNTPSNNGFNSMPTSNIPPQQNFSTTSPVNDEDLLRAFIGNNYEKITKKSFNFAGFFFNSLYLCYRKMFGYGILTWLVYLIVYNVVNAFVPVLSFILAIGLSLAVGFFVNKVYLSYAKKKIAIIKASNPQKSNEELKAICAAKGGTSTGKIFLGLLVQIIMAFVVVFIMALVGISSFIGDFLNVNNWNIIVNDGNSSGGASTTNGTLLEDVSVSGYGCFGSKCNVTIDNSNGDSEDYNLGISNSDFFNKLGDYKDYVKLDIYYNKKGNSKTIVGYKIYLKSNNEDISSISTESELRDKIGLFSVGAHTENMTLKEIGSTGFGFEDDESYTYTEYTFVDSKNIEYEMKYKGDDGTLNLTEGSKYDVTFDVVEGTFEYEFIIKSIK